MQRSWGRALQAKGTETTKTNMGTSLACWIDVVGADMVKNEQIEEIIGQMETGDVSLDQSFELYKNGLEEIKAANAMLDEMEKAMLVLNEDGSLEEF